MDPPVAGVGRTLDVSGERRIALEPWRLAPEAPLVVRRCLLGDGVLGGWGSAMRPTALGVGVNGGGMA